MERKGKGKEERGKGKRKRREERGCKKETTFACLKKDGKSRVEGKGQAKRQRQERE